MQDMDKTPPQSGEVAKPPGGDESAPESFLADKTIFPNGKVPPPGTRLTVEVVREYEDEVELKRVGDESSVSEPRPDAAEAQLAALAE